MPKRFELDPAAMDMLVIATVSGMSRKGLQDTAIKLDIPEAYIDAALVAVRKRITIAAEFDRDAEVGIAYTRLNDVYRRALTGQDMKTALAAQKELNKLIGLYDRSADLPVSSSSNVDAALAREHLVGLGIGGSDDSLAELARQVAARFMELDS